MYKRGLLAHDLSDIADCLLGFIPALIEQGMDRLDLVHVTDSRYPGGQAANMSSDEVEAALQERVDYITAKYDLTVRSHNRRGFPAGQILNTAHEIEAELIIAGSRGHNWLSEYMIGSTAADLIRISKKPLLLGRFKEPEDTEHEIPPLMTSTPWDNMVVGTDLSEVAGRVENTVQQLCEYSDDIHLVSVYTSKMAKKYSREDIKGHLEKISSKYSPSCNVDFRTEEGVTSRVLENIANEVDASLIVVGKRGGGALRKLLLGSTPAELSRFSSHHLLIIP